MAIVSSESFADSSHVGIFERHVLCMQSGIHLPLHPASASINSFDYRLQKKLPVKLHYSDTIVISSWYFVEINDN